MGSADGTLAVLSLGKLPAARVKVRRQARWFWFAARDPVVEHRQDCAIRLPHCVALPE
jgi:hypothetical protein